MEYKTNQFGAIVKDKFTRSYLSFSNEIQQSELFILMFNIGGYYIENNKEQAKQSLIDIYNHDTNEFAKSLVNYFRSSTADHLFNIRTYQQFYGQMAYARSIDNVVAYFKDILAEVILKTPQVLRSKETERLDFILAFDSIEEIRIALSEKKIESLFYCGIDKIEEFFKDKLGINLFKTESDKIQFTIAVKSRNLIVHKRAKISKAFMKEFPDAGFSLGSILSYSYEDISRINLTLSNYISILDDEIGVKFGLDFILNTGWVA